MSLSPFNNKKTLIENVVLIPHKFKLTTELPEAKVVFLSDSLGALQAISSGNSNSRPKQSNLVLNKAEVQPTNTYDSMTNILLVRCYILLVLCI